MSGLTKHISGQSEGFGAALALLFRELLCKTDQMLDKLRIITLQLSDITGSDATEKDIGDID